MLVGLRALKNLIKKARPYSRDDGVQYFLKAGDLATAVKDFRSMKPNAVRKYSTVRRIF